MKNQKEGFANLGSYLKQKRQSIGLSQSELADKLGIHKQYVSNYERGICEPPCHSRKKITKILKTSRPDIAINISRDMQSVLKNRIRQYCG